MWRRSKRVCRIESRLPNSTIYLSPAPRFAGSLESSESSEKKIVADVLGSLKEPCKAGRPDMAIGTNGESLKPRTGKLILGFQDLSIKPLSDP